MILLFMIIRFHASHGWSSILCFRKLQKWTSTPWCSDSRNTPGLNVEFACSLHVLHSPKTCRLKGDSKLPVRCDRERSCLYVQALWWTGGLSKVYPALSPPIPAGNQPLTTLIRMINVPAKWMDTIRKYSNVPFKMTPVSQDVLRASLERANELTHTEECVQ